MGRSVNKEPAPPGQRIVYEAVGLHKLALLITAEKGIAARRKAFQDTLIPLMVGFWHEQAKTAQTWETVQKTFAAAEDDAEMSIQLKRSSGALKPEALALLAAHNVPVAQTTASWAVNPKHATPEAMLQLRKLVLQFQLDNPASKVFPPDFITEVASVKVPAEDAILHALRIADPGTRLAVLNLLGTVAVGDVEVPVTAQKAFIGDALRALLFPEPSANAASPERDGGDAAPAQTPAEPANVVSLADAKAKAPKPDTARKGAARKASR